jgi:glycosyltransferase involved in cell wall biosynthesis
MRILECLDSINPANGGTVESTRQRTVGLQALGYDVELLTLDEPASRWLPAWPAQAHGVGPLLVRYTPRLVPWLRAHAARYDAIIVNGIWGFHGVGVWKALRNGPVPYIVIPHGMLNPWFRRPFTPKHIKKTLVWKSVVSKVLNRARAVFFTCEQERALGRTLYTPYECVDDVVSLVGTRIDLRNRTEARHRVNARHPEIGSGRLILYLSRLDPMKGCDLLVDAFAKTCRQDEDVHLVIAGPAAGSFPETIRRLGKTLGISHRITITGEVDFDMKLALLASADLFALPSHCEAFPLAVVEALGNGVPVLITNKVNICREIEEDGAALVGNDDVSSIARLLGDWASLDAAGRFALSVRARQCFERRYDVATVSRHFVSALERHGILGGRPAIGAPSGFAAMPVTL